MSFFHSVLLHWFAQAIEIMNRMKRGIHSPRFISGYSADSHQHNFTNQFRLLLELFKIIFSAFWILKELAYRMFTDKNQRCACFIWTVCEWNRNVVSIGEIWKPFSSSKTQSKSRFIWMVLKQPLFVCLFVYFQAKHNRTFLAWRKSCLFNVFLNKMHGLQLQLTINVREKRWNKTQASVLWLFRAWIFEWHDEEKKSWTVKVILPFGQNAHTHTDHVVSSTRCAYNAMQCIAIEKYLCR